MRQPDQIQCRYEAAGSDTVSSTKTRRKQGELSACLPYKTSRENCLWGARKAPQRTHHILGLQVAEENVATMNVAER